eukprot:scaffold1012_cov418-Prasinococcus_capsulatus_cf.AAC.3
MPHLPAFLWRRLASAAPPYVDGVDVPLRAGPPAGSSHVHIATLGGTFGRLEPMCDHTSRRGRAGGISRATEHLVQPVHVELHVQ